jgi:hypothetical protein
MTQATSPYLNRPPRTLAEVLPSKPTADAQRIWRVDDPPGGGFLWIEIWSDGRHDWAIGQRYLAPGEDANPFVRFVTPVS